jgi:hypothetical protein
MQSRLGSAHERETPTISEILLITKTPHHVLVVNVHRKQG